jgi:ADP-heptose:LPS heptosyltransferase
LFLGHDSGVSHLAAAVGTPCVLLFGPTDPAMWAPPGEYVRVIHRGPEMSAISVDTAWTTVTAQR